MKKTEKSIFLMNGSISCEPSAYLFNKVVTYLKLNHYCLTDDDIGKSDTALINTCCVTATKIADAEKLIEDAMGRPNLKRIVVFGCYSKINKKYRSSKKLLFIGPKELERFDGIFRHSGPIGTIFGGSLSKKSFEPYQSKITRRDRYILISQGCSHHCSYCNIKLAKGSVLSRPESEILNEIALTGKNGQRDIVLLSDDCGSYGSDIKTDLASLLEKIIFSSPDLKLKISTIFPGDLIRLLPRLRPLLRSRQISYINVPIQSGSDRLLKLMGRDYRCQDVLRAVKVIKALSPGTWLYSHILMNFPTESRRDFKLSLDAALHFDELMFITYSKNPLTKASALGAEVGEEERMERILLAKHFTQTMGRGIVVEKP